MRAYPARCMTPAVSIILPTFNRLELLRSSMDSVLSQTFRDWELIIADDGSDVLTTGKNKDEFFFRAQFQLLL